MKAKLINQKEKVFEPFEIAILFETQNEVDNFVEELTEPDNMISMNYIRTIVDALLPKTSSYSNKKPNPPIRKS